MPSRARSTDWPALVTAPRLWGQTKSNTRPCRVMRYSLDSSTEPKRSPGRHCRPGRPCYLDQGHRAGEVRGWPSTGRGRGGGALQIGGTVPLEDTVATALLPMLHTGVEEVPLTFTWKEG